MCAANCTFYSSRMCRIRLANFCCICLLLRTLNLAVTQEWLITQRPIVRLNFNYCLKWIQKTHLILLLYHFTVKPLVVQIRVPISHANSSRSQAGSVSSLSSLNSSTYRLLVVSAGRKSDIECRSWGSRPPAEISWWKGSRRLPTAASRSHYTNSQESEAVVSLNDATNLTISTLSYTAAPEDDGQRLTCRADNLQLSNEELEDSVTISVRCKFFSFIYGKLHLCSPTAQVANGLPNGWLKSHLQDFLLTI